MSTESQTLPLNPEMRSEFLSTFTKHIDDGQYLEKLQLYLANNDYRFVHHIKDSEKFGEDEAQYICQTLGFQVVTIEQALEVLKQFRIALVEKNDSSSMAMLDELLLILNIDENAEAPLPICTMLNLMDVLIEYEEYQIIVSETFEFICSICLIGNMVEEDAGAAEGNGESDSLE
jgi:hypothetical protein